MCIQKGHATIFSDPIKFFFPDLNITLLHNYKEREVLGKRVGEFYVTGFPRVVAEPDGKDGPHAVRRVPPQPQSEPGVLRR